VFLSALCLSLRRPRPGALRRTLSALALAMPLLLPALAPRPARAADVLERVARSGELVMVGYGDVPPLLSMVKGKPRGYATVVGERVAAELSRATGKPVRLVVRTVNDPAALLEAVSSGKADLACGLPFSWDQDMRVDHTLPIGLSGLRLMAPAGRFDGNPEALAGRSIGVVRQSLAEGELLGMQPKARAVAFNDLPAALAALQAGQVEGVIGDSVVLSGLAAQRGNSDWILAPELPYEVYAVSCLVPPNSSSYRHLVDLAIARLLQGYLDRDPAAVAAVDRWIGPGSAVGIPQERLDVIFAAAMLGVEAIRPLPANAP
jgi:polar amino acid transport system substrate-binding protein